MLFLNKKAVLQRKSKQNKQHCLLIAQTFCNIHFIYVWNCKNSRCYKKLQLLLDQSRLAVLLILFFFGQKKSFLWQIWQKRLLWLKSILCNHNSVITLLSTHEIIHVCLPLYCCTMSYCCQRNICLLYTSPSPRD